MLLTKTNPFFSSLKGAERTVDYTCRNSTLWRQTCSAKSMINSMTSRMGEDVKEEVEEVEAEVAKEEEDREKVYLKRADLRTTKDMRKRENLEEMMIFQMDLDQRNMMRGERRRTE